MSMKYKLRVGGFDKLSTIDSNGIAFAIYFQGCSIRCKGCHNPEFQPFEGGEEYSPSEILEMIRKHLDWYDNLVLVGGEPLDQPVLPLYSLMLGAKELGLNIWLFTGYTEDKIPAEIKKLCSVIVAGKFENDLKTGGFPASSNQEVIRRNLDEN